MIGIVVVTHGRVAEELVNAARTIHGELTGMVAVPLGWGDDASQARAAAADSTTVAWKAAPSSTRSSTKPRRW